jgi:hypothetical protein
MRRSKSWKRGSARKGSKSGSAFSQIRKKGLVFIAKPGIDDGVQLWPDVLMRRHFAHFIECGDEFLKILQMIAKCSRCLCKLAPVSFILRFHLRHDLDEFGRLSDTVQISITLEQGVTGKTSGGGFA